MQDPEIIFERSLYIANAISLVALGVQAVMYILSLYFMSNLNPNHGAKSATRFYALYGLALFILLTIATACNILFGQLAWIEHRDIPGGIPAFIAENTAAWYNTFGTSAGFLMSYLGDGLLVYRCYIIWNSNWKVVVLPILIYFTSIAFSILTVDQSAVPGSSFFSGKAVDFGVPYTSLVVALNTLVTILICYRLLSMRRRMKSVGLEDTDSYTGVTAMMIESAAPIAILGILYTVFNARQDPTSVAFAIMYGTSTGVSPQLIIFRTSLGKAWSKDMSARISSMQFGSTTTQLPQNTVTVGYTQDNGSTAVALSTMTKNEAEWKTVTV